MMFPFKTCLVVGLYIYSKPVPVILYTSVPMELVLCQSEVKKKTTLK